MANKPKRAQVITNIPQNSSNLTLKLDSELSKKNESTPKSKQQIDKEYYQNKCLLGQKNVSLVITYFGKIIPWCIINFSGGSTTESNDSFATSIKGISGLFSLIILFLILNTSISQSCFNNSITCFY